MKLKKLSNVFITFFIAVCESVTAYNIPYLTDLIFIDPKYEDFFEKFFTKPRRGIKIIKKQNQPPDSASFQEKKKAREDKQNLKTTNNSSTKKVISDADKVKDSNKKVTLQKKNDKNVKPKSVEKTPKDVSRIKENEEKKVTTKIDQNKTACDKNNSEIYDIRLLFDSKYSDFKEAFTERFKNTDDIWLVLGNRGGIDYYKERFSSHWIYWDFNTSDETLGISGNFLDIKNWHYLSQVFPKKVSYIAVDQNELIRHKRKNAIIKAAGALLRKGGVFCLEDIYTLEENKFENFSKEDFDELSKDYKIKFAMWDGFVASLPYTCYTGSNKRTGLYSGLEMMILKLASASFPERKKLLQYISLKLNGLISQLSEKEISFIVKDVISSEILCSFVKNYKGLVEEKKLVEKDVEKHKTEIKDLKADTENYSNLINFNKKMKSNLNKLNQGVKMIQKGADFFTGEKHTGGTGAISKLSNFFSREKELKKLEQQITANKEKLAAKKRSLEELETQLKLLKQNLEQTEKDLLKLYNGIFDRFEENKFFKPYVKYRKKSINDIVEENEEITNYFLSTFDEYTSKISKIEKIAKELENAWSPHVILNSLTDKEVIERNSKCTYEENLRVLIVLVKK